MRTRSKAGVLTGAVLLAAAATGTFGIGVADAHANTVHLTVVCSNGQQTETATITNNYNLTETASISQAAVNAGWGPASVNIGKTHGQQISTGTMSRILPGNDTSTTSLQVTGNWSDGFTQTATSDPLTLPGGCDRTPAMVVFTEQQGCYGGYFTIPTRAGVDYYTSVGDPAVLTPVGPGQHSVQVNTTPTLTVIAKDHDTGDTIGKWTHTFSPAIACFHQGSYHLTAATPCGGPVHITGYIDLDGYNHPTTFAVLDTPANGVPIGPVTTVFTASPGQQISVYFPLPVAARTVPGKDTVVVFLTTSNFGDTLQNFNPVLTVQVAPVCPKPAVHPVVKKTLTPHTTPVTAPVEASPVLANTGAYRPLRAAAGSVAAVLLGIGMLLAAGRRRA